MREPTKEQRENMTKQPNDVAYYWEEDIEAYKDMDPARAEFLKKAPLAVAICQAVGVLLFVLTLGKLCGM